MNTNPTPLSTDGRMASIVVQGNAYQRGVQYGKALGPHLEAFYGWFVQKEPKDVLTCAYRAVLEKMEAATARHFPLALDEIKGWSDGSALGYDKCRILAFHNEITNVLPPNCSNLIVTQGPEGPWLGRNSDLYGEERRWQIRKEAHCDDGHSSLQTLYVGLLIGTGINDAGLCIGGSSLPAATGEVPEGVPNYAYFLLSTQSTVQDCCRQFERIGFVGKGVHLAMLDSSGDAAAVELGGGRISIRKPNAQGWLVLANHSVTGKTPSPPMTAELEKFYENSHARFDRLTQLLETSGPNDWAPGWGHRALGDHAGPISVCQHIDGSYRTIYGSVLRPGQSRQRMDLCWGYPCHGEFQTFEL